MLYVILLFTENCRKKYTVIDQETGFEMELDNEYIMSPKDLCTIDFLDQIIDAGVKVLKIEGRGRAPEYVANVIKCYRDAIDSIEAGIIVKNRLLGIEESRLKLAKAKLELSNYLWLENNIPFELSDDLIPEINLELSIQETLKTNDLMNNQVSLSEHPKINALQNKIEILNIDRKLKANMLLPKIDLGYSYLSEPSYINNYQFKDYKVGMNFYFPLFLRKERGNLKLAKFKVQETEFLLKFEQLQLQNKINAQKIELKSYLKQIEIAKSLSDDNNKMLKSEEKLFLFGESSLFIINTRENNLVTAKLSQIALENRYFVSNSELFKIMANPD